MRENNLIEQIKENLLQYEEPYRLGAWEEFKRHRKARYRAKQARWIAAAAAIVLVALLASYRVMVVSETSSQLIAEEPIEQAEQPDPGRDVILHEILPHVHATDETPSEPEETSPHITKTEELRAVKHEPASLQSTDHYSDLIAYRQIPNLDDALSRNVHFGDHDITAAGMKLMNVSTEKESVFYEETTITESKLTALQSHRPGLSFGFAYSPLLNVAESATDWNIGAGLSIQWDFMEQLSLSSGLFMAQSQLQYRGEPARLTSTTNQVDSADMEIDFLSLEIPFNLQYSMSSRFFLSGGISSASLLKEQYTYHYETHRITTTQVFIEGEYQPVTQLVIVNEMEKQSEPTLSSFHPLAFYNFSFGYNFDEAGNGRFTITIEPFLKIPAHSFSSRSVSYSTGGLQLKVVF
jgi:hypothetical protein